MCVICEVRVLSFKAYKFNNKLERCALSHRSVHRVSFACPEPQNVNNQRTIRIHLKLGYVRPTLQTKCYGGLGSQKKCQKYFSFVELNLNSRLGKENSELTKNTCNTKFVLRDFEQHFFCALCFDNLPELRKMPKILKD